MNIVINFVKRLRIYAKLVPLPSAELFNGAADRIEKLESFEVVAIALQKRIKELESESTMTLNIEAQDKRIEHLESALKRLAWRKDFVFDDNVANPTDETEWWSAEYRARIKYAQEALK